MLRRNHIHKLFLILFVFVFIPVLKSQEIPESSRHLLDSINSNENLLDSNEVYKKQFDSLSKDGEWIKVEESELLNDLTGEVISYDIPYYTDYIYFWRPYGANPYWHPYLNGAWAFSQNGWMWLSSYNWGWAPYNYGRWFNSSMYGWMWLPGSLWGPNWVDWRHYGGYLGWYPTFPVNYWGGMSNQVSTNRDFTSRPSNWAFVHLNDFTKRIDENTIVAVSENADILKNSEKISPSEYSGTDVRSFRYSGPNVEMISKVTGEKIYPKEVVISDAKRKQYEDDNYITTYMNTGGTNVVISERNERVIRNGNTRGSQTEATAPTDKKKVRNKKSQENTRGYEDAYKGGDSNTKSSSNDNTKSSNTTKSTDGNSNSDKDSGTRTK